MFAVNLKSKSCVDPDWLLDLGLRLHFFLNKTFRLFKYVCNKTLACKIDARFHRLTKMSRDQNNQYRKVP